MSRVQTAYKNSRAVFVYQFTSVILAFLSKKIFVVTMGMAFLGYNAVFTNILSALNLAELGIGFAITSFLYRPLAEHNETKVNALLYMYRKIYQILGIFVLVVGIIASFFLPLFIKDASHDMSYLRFLFYINLVGTVSTYYLAYHRTLLIANQKNYVTAGIDTILNVVLTAFQIFVMLRVPRYEIFLVLELLKSLIGNIIITFLCKKQYPFLRQRPDKKVVAEYRISVVTFVKDAFCAKIGAYVFYGTDNIIISIFKGSILTGFLSNYTMVVTTLQVLITQMLYSIQAVLGNYIFSVKDRDKERQMCDNYLFLNYFIGNFSMICMVFLIQPFIELFFGKEFLLTNSTAFLLGTNLMLIIISQMPSQLFSLYQLYRYDKYIVAISAVLNIVISVALVKPLGIDGVLIGTFVTSLIYIFSRIKIIWSKIFQTSSLYVYGRLALYFAVTAVTALITALLSRKFQSVNIVSFILQAGLTAVVALIVPLIIFARTKAEQFLFTKAKEFVECGGLVKK